MQPRATRGREGAGTRAPAAALLDLGADSARRSCARSPQSRDGQSESHCVCCDRVARGIFQYYNVRSSIDCADRLCSGAPVGPLSRALVLDPAGQASLLKLGSAR